MESKEKSSLDELKEYKNQGGGHASILLNKLEKISNSKENEEAKNYLSLTDVINKYLEYRKTINTHIKELDFIKIAECLNDYKDFSKNKKKELGFEVQEAKSFYSTILEEFLLILFSKNNESWVGLETGGNVEVYSNIYFNPKSLKNFIHESSYGVDKKKQDFTIYKNCKINIDGKEDNLKIPIISVECKTNLDKTMLQSSIATAEKVKRGNPHAKFYIVVELYDVSYEEDVYGNLIDQIYILRKQKRRWKKMKEGKEALKPIDSEVIKSLWEDIAGFLNKEVWSDNKGFLEKIGKLIDKTSRNEK